jgi:hypothetical protein
MAKRMSFGPSTNSRMAVGALTWGLGSDRPGGYTRVLRVEPREKNEYFSAKKGDKNAIRELTLAEGTEEFGKHFMWCLGNVSVVIGLLIFFSQENETSPPQLFQSGRGSA